MLIKDSLGRERIACVEDFEDVTITFTPQEWSDLLEFFEYRKRYSPSTFHKTTRTIHKKLVENKPQLKKGLVEIKEDQNVQA